MNFENFYVPENEKNDDWCQMIARQIAAQGIASLSFNIERAKDFQRWDFIKGVYNLDRMAYLTDPFGNGQETPARYVHYDLINVKLEKIVGDYLGQPLTFFANITNREGHERKLELAAKVIAEHLIAPHAAMIQQMTGVDVSDPTVSMMSPEERQQAATMNKKDAIEEFTENALNYLIDRYNFDVEFQKLLKDICVSSKAFTYTRIVNGDPVTKRVDPRTMIYDFDMVDANTLENSGWQAHERFLTVNEIISEYRNYLTPDQITELKTLTGKNLSSLLNQNSYMTGYYRIYSNGSFRIRVAHTVWCSTRLKEWSVSDNPYDPENPILLEVTEEQKKKHPGWYKNGLANGKIISKEGDDWWETTMIGWPMFIKMQRIKDQPRNQSWGYARSASPYRGYVKDPIDGLTMSLVDRLENIQLMWNEVWFNIDFLLGRTNGNVIQYDIAQKPESLTKAQVMTLAKNHGFVFMDSRKEGIRSNAFNQFSTANMSNTGDIVALIQIAKYIEDVADVVTGLNRAWQGDTKASETVRNNQSNIQQANSITRPIYQAHAEIVEATLNGLANLFKYAGWKETGRMSYILDDGSVKSFIIPEDFRLDDLGIKLKVGLEEKQMKDKINQMADAALASGAIDFKSALDLLPAQTAIEAKALFEQGLQIMEKNRAAQQQAEAQQAQIPLQTAQMQQQNAFEMKKLDIEAQIAVAKIKAGTETGLAQLDADLQRDLLGQQNKNSIDQKMLDHSHEAAMQGSQNEADQQLQEQQQAQQPEQAQAA